MKPNLKQIADEVTGRITSTALVRLASRIMEDAGVDWDLLDGWRFKVNNRATSRLGCCKYRERIIEVSGWIANNPANKAQAVRTLAHEMAHALAGDMAGHGPLWQTWARRLGHNGQRRASAFAAEIQHDPARTVICTFCGKKGIAGPRQVKRLSRYVSKCCRAPFKRAI